MKIFTVRNMAGAMIVLFCLVLVFHALVLTGIIPYENAWGGRLNSYEEMIVFEVVSVVINLLMMLTVWLKRKYYDRNLKHTFINVLLWIMGVLFSLNTIGNLFAESQPEKLIATPLTLLSAIMCLILANSNRNSESGNPV